MKHGKWKQVWEQAYKGLNDLANSPYYVGLFRNTESFFFTRNISGHPNEHSTRFKVSFSVTSFKYKYRFTWYFVRKVLISRKF